MIRPLRRFHRRVLPWIALVAAALVTAALLGRAPEPAPDPAPPEIAARGGRAR